MAAASITGIESRNHAIEVKRTARLLDLELHKAQALAELALSKRCWVADTVLSTQAWEKYGGVVAPDLSNVAWNDVAMAFLAVGHIEGARAFYQGGVLHDSPISDNIAGTIAPMVTDVTRGRESLAPFVYGDDPHHREAGRLEIAKGTTESIEAEKQNALKDNC